MNLRTTFLASAVALCSLGATAAQAQSTTQKSTPTVVPQSPAKTQTTTSTSTTTAVPDETGNVAATQNTTDTTTSTQPAPAMPGTPAATSRTTSTTTMAPDETGTPATTTTTTTKQPAADQTGAAVTAATAADVKAGVPVFDQKGGVVGKIESVSAKGAVVSTGKARASIPVASFGKNDKGLVVSMSKTELEGASATAAKTAPPKKNGK